ncbi:hypothetical protein BH11MYX4_BH11MYX4_17430 [soil metagenome]
MSVIAISVIVHGISSRPLLARYEKARADSRDPEPHPHR